MTSDVTPQSRAGLDSEWEAGIVYLTSFLAPLFSLTCTHSTHTCAQVHITPLLHPPLGAFILCQREEKRRGNDEMRSGRVGGKKKQMQLAGCSANKTAVMLAGDADLCLPLTPLTVITFLEAPPPTSIHRLRPLPSPPADPRLVTWH